MTAHCVAAGLCRGALEFGSNTLKEVKRFAEALASYDRALKVRPDFCRGAFQSRCHPA